MTIGTVGTGTKTTNAAGETVIRVDSPPPMKVASLKKTVVPAEALSLWEILVDRTKIESFDGSREVVLKPLSLRTLAKLERVQADHAQAFNGDHIGYAIKFLTVMLNDANSLPKGKEAMTEEEVGDLLDGSMFPIAMRIIQEAVRPLTESLNALMGVTAVQATGGEVSSDSLPANTDGAPPKSES